tara:strand:+ start:348 stop:482 length:135 start_codon:yes stop_codon:yes gene_type:complete
MTTTLLYPIISKGFALLYFPLFFAAIMIIDRMHVPETVADECDE